MPYLAKDIYSNQNPSKQYGYKGQEVDVVSDHHGIFIVRPKDGSLGFHVLRDELTGLPDGKGEIVAATPGLAPVDQKAPPSEQGQPPARRSGRGRPDPKPPADAPSAQGSLF